jgi:hypothetical protein
VGGSPCILQLTIRLSWKYYGTAFLKVHSHGTDDFQSNLEFPAHGEDEFWKTRETEAGEELVLGKLAQAWRNTDCCKASAPAIGV